MGLAVDEDGAHAAGALTTAIFWRKVADVSPKCIQKVLTAFDEHRLLAAV